MTKTVDKILVHSETGLIEEIVPKDGEPLAIKVTQIKEKPVLISEQKIEEAKTHINNSVALADACLEIAKPLHIAEFQNHLNAVQGLGDIIKGIVKFIPGETNPIVEKLGNLEKKIEKLGEKMSENFAEMKVFITEVKFFVNIMSPTSTMMKYFRDCLKYPCPESVENFKRAYKKHSPMELAYKLMSYLERKSTNPLRMAMDAEKAKTKTTFDKWVAIFSRFLAQFLFLESFANGLLGVKNQYTRDLLISRAKEILVIINQWKEEYKKDEHYWEEVKTYFETFIPAHTELNNSQKAKEIAAKLDTYLTSDAFHVCVFNEGYRLDDYTYYCPNESNQMIKSFFNIGKCNAFVYRSKKSHEMSKEDYENIRNGVNDKCRDKKLKLDYYNPMPTMIKQQILEKELVRGDGLIFICDENRNPFMEIANCPEFPDKGPGYWQLIYLDVGIATIDDSLVKKTMLVSFP